MCNETLPRSEEVRIIELKHSERLDQNSQKQDEKKTFDTNLFSSGTLSHKFALKSVYQHHNGFDAEATTFQDEWVTVDYIFFR